MYTYTRHKTSIRPRSVVLDFPLKVCFFVLMSVTLYSFDFHYFDFFNLFVNVFLLFKQQPKRHFFRDFYIKPTIFTKLLDARKGEVVLLQPKEVLLRAKRVSV